MDSSVTSFEKLNAPANGQCPLEGYRPATRTVDFLPNDIVRHRMGDWRGVHVETIQVISQERFEYSFKHTNHLLVAIEHGARYDGELQVEGLPTSSARSCSHKLILVPAGRRFFGWQHPRQLTRSICVYVDPRLIVVDPDCRFDEVDLQPKMLFEDIDLWQTVGKLKAQIGSCDPSSCLYAEALGGVLAHELLLLNGTIDVSKQAHRGGLARWQQRRIIDFMEEHLAEDISLGALAGLVRLSPSPHRSRKGVALQSCCIDYPDRVGFGFQYDKRIQRHVPSGDGRDANELPPRATMTKNYLVGSILVDRPAAVPAFPFIAGPAEGSTEARGPIEKRRNFQLEDLTNGAMRR